MSSSDPSLVQPPARWLPVDDRPAGTPPQARELGAHASRPFESLYRPSADAPATSYRAAVRHFVPALTPPEGEPDADDTFHWLYRTDTAADAAPTVADPETPAPSAEVAPTIEPLVAAPDPRPGPQTTTRRWGRRRVGVGTLMVLGLAVVGALMAL